MTGLNAADRQWLDHYGETLCRDYPEAVARFAVFGSKARGEAGPESDLDVLLVVRDAHEARLPEIKEAGHGLRDDPFTLPQIVGTTEGAWRRALDKGMVFPNEVEDEAVDLVRDGVLVDTATAIARRSVRRRHPGICAQDGRRDGGQGRLKKAKADTYPADVQNQWRLALRALSSTKFMAGGDHEVEALSRAYYATFHATQAALFAIGVNAKTHRGTETQFHKWLIRTGELPEKWMKFYGNLREAREAVDYGETEHEPPSGPAAHVFLRRAEEYLLVIRAYLGTKGIAVAYLPEDPPAGGNGT